jgi:sugar phosphate isomerase/epimerase
MDETSTEPQRPPAALSTMWAQQSRFQGDGFLEFIRIALDSGYEAIEPSHSTPVEHLELLRTRALIAVPSIHAPAPRERQAGRWVMDYSLTSDNIEDRRLSVQFHKRTIDYAVELGARQVVVHLGDTTRSPYQAERRVRELYNSGVRDGDEIEKQRAAAHAARAERAGTYMQFARESLAELAEYASLRGVGLGLENRLSFFEGPLPAEAAELMTPYPADLVGYWHDVGHAEVLHRQGLVNREDWFEHCGNRVVGTHLHDVNEILDHRAPGNGNVDWQALLARLAPNAARTLEINQHEPEGTLAPAVDLLKRNRIL